MLKLYNSLSRHIEEFSPLHKNKVHMYTCGPTIYDYPTIGNWRTYTLSDILVRTLSFLGYEVNHIMNLTDVGHLSGDNLGDPNTGIDRMSKASQREGVDAWTIADKYGTDFVESFPHMHMLIPQILPKATSHIKEQISLIKKLDEKGLTYTISDGVYFDIAEYEKRGHSYGELSNLDHSEKASRIEKNIEKKDQRDFALWKFFAKGQKRHNMEWESPWGTGYPGWHIECSAMSMKYLGDQFDVHIGGEDLKSTHHPNEIAQSEAATNKSPFVTYWLHGAFLQVDGGKMGKSLGNAYTLHDVHNRGFKGADLRYLYFGAHYRKQLNFTWELLEKAQIARTHLLSLVNVLEKKQLDITQEPYYLRFVEAITSDLNIPQALGVTWEMAQDKTLPPEIKDTLFTSFNSILAINDDDVTTIQKSIPPHILERIHVRNTLRREGKYDQADEIRHEIEKLGYQVVDSENETTVLLG